MPSLLETFYGTGTFQRPDDRRGVDRKTQQAGGDDFPYDKDPTVKWGEPAAYSRMSAGHGPNRQNVPVPKGISQDDDRWKNEVGREGWISDFRVTGNIVQDPGRLGPDLDDEVDEAMGTPVNVAKAGQGTGGMHTGGRVAPGTSGGWSSGPSGGQWDKHMNDDELEKAGRIEEFMAVVHSPARRPYNPGKTNDTHDQTDDEIEQMVHHHIPTDDETREPEDFDTMMNTIGGTNFGVIGHGMKYHRMSPGMSWKESISREVGVNDMLTSIYERRVKQTGEKK